MVIRDVFDDVFVVELCAHFGGKQPTLVNQSKSATTYESN